MEVTLDLCPEPGLNSFRSRVNGFTVGAGSVSPLREYLLARSPDQVFQNGAAREKIAEITASPACFIVATVTPGFTTPSSNFDACSVKRRRFDIVNRFEFGNVPYLLA